MILKKENDTLVMFKCKRKYEIQKCKKKERSFADFKFNQSFIDTLWFIYINIYIIIVIYY